MVSRGEEGEALGAKNGEKVIDNMSRNMFQIIKAFFTHANLDLQGSYWNSPYYIQIA